MRIKYLVDSDGKVVASSSMVADVTPEEAQEGWVEGPEGLAQSLVTLRYDDGEFQVCESMTVTFPEATTPGTIEIQYELPDGIDNEINLVLAKVERDRYGEYFGETVETKAPVGGPVTVSFPKSGEYQVYVSTRNHGGGGKRYTIV